MIEKKVLMAIDRLKTFMPPEGYYLAFSGGKDSIVIHRLAVMSGVKFDAHYNSTSVDPPDLIYFIRNNYPDVIEEPYKRSMWEMIPKKLMPPTRMVRYCCEELKERGGHNRVVVTGIRAAESTKRSKRKMVETCFKDTTKRYMNVIFDWTDADVWNFIRQEKIKYCKLYDQGFERIGCIGCPMTSPKKRWIEFNRFPRYKESYIRTFDKMLVVRKEREKKCEWTSGEQVFNWWMENKESEHQTMMFD